MHNRNARKVRSSNLGPDTLLPDWDLWGFSYVPSREMLRYYLDWAMATFSKSLQFNIHLYQLTTHRSIVQFTDKVVNDTI
jgi:hypothetical protein